MTPTDRASRECTMTSQLGLGVQTQREYYVSGASHASHTDSSAKDDNLINNSKQRKIKSADDSDYATRRSPLAERAKQRAC